MSRTTKKKLKIEGMHCDSCAMNIDFDLEDVVGIKSVKTSYARQESEIEFDPKIIDIATVIAQIKKIGYTAYPIENK